MRLDKVTEYWATYTRQTRGTGIPVEILKQLENSTTTGRTRRYLRIDNAKEFTSHYVVRKSFWIPTPSTAMNFVILQQQSKKLNFFAAAGFCHVCKDSLSIPSNVITF